LQVLSDNNEKKSKILCTIQKTFIIFAEYFLIKKALTYSQIKKSVGDAWAFLSNPTYKNGVLQTADLLYFNTDKSKVAERLMANKKGHYRYLTNAKLSLCHTSQKKFVQKHSS